MVTWMSLIGFMHNKTDAKIEVEENGRGKLQPIKSGERGGPYNTSLVNLTFKVKSKRPVYVEFEPGEHKGDIKHIDGEVGHPPPDK